MKPQILLLLLIIPLSTYAQITTDSTLGQALPLSGPNYQIESYLGQQHGDNLFHSFQDFNLQSFESATFSGPNHIQNVISRVTGGNPSNIDGLIRSTIPNADFYFLNPYGILFGPNARLDVQGSFHASTADYLRLGENGRFDARNPSDSLLTVAPIESFGFLTPTEEKNIASISVQRYGEITQTDWDGNPTGLFVSEGNTLSLIGGKIEIKNGTFFRTVTIDDDGNESTEINSLPSISSPYGRINLVGVASSGEVKLGNDFVDVSSFAQLADISITEQSLLEISGEGAGHLFIRGQDITLTDSQIRAKSFGDRDNGIINLHSNGSILFQEGSRLETETTGKGQGATVSFEAEETIQFSGINYNGSHGGIFQDTSSKKEGAGNGGTLSLKAKNLFLDGSEVIFWTRGKGNAGNITIRIAEILTLKDHNPTTLEASVIRNSPSATSNGGHGGSIVIEARDILLADGSYISGSTFGPGDGANIIIRAKGTITLTGVNKLGHVSGIFSQTVPISPSLESKNAGNILIEAEVLFLENGALISSNTIGPPGQKSGNSGNITIRARTIEISGINVHGQNGDGFGGGIVVSSKSTGGHAGDAGEIIIEADSLSLKEGGLIASSSLGTGKGGQITLNVSGSIEISGDSSKIDRKLPLSSQLRFQSRNLTWTADQESISGIYASSEDTTEQAGQGGTITLYANHLFIDDKGKISTASAGGGLAGNINIHASEGILIFNDGAITTEAKSAGGGGINIKTDNLLRITNSQVTTSVQQNSGAGGNIALNSEFVVLENGKIIARAYEGDGGNMNITTTGIYRFPPESKSPIDASSKLGVDGEITVNSPDSDISGQLLVLSTDMVNATDQMQPPCSSRIAENLSRFVLVESEGISTSPDDLLPSGPHLSQLKPVKNSNSQKESAVTKRPQLALLIECRSKAQMTSTKGKSTSRESRIIPEQLF
ncbi:Large exoprotein containing haemagglutination activity domain [Beggiatoa sp. PS]|nr:Large exoprotein containing haemagglutination activity domain [Beggiatoa sp. PS]